MISTVVLTRNRAQMLSKCLEALDWCDEVIVLDDRSTDDTKTVVGKFKNATHFSRHLDNNFAAQHNFGMSKSSNNWVLFVDDDEIVNESLANEIKQVVSQDTFDGFFLKRDDIFMGKQLRHGETGNISFLRLGKKNKGKWSREVHEVWQIEGKIDKLENHLIHNSHANVSSMIDKINLYTSIDAAHMVNVDGVKFNLVRVFVNPVGKFLQNYLLRLGFLDGLPGFVMAFMMSLNSLIVRVKQYDLSKSS